MDDWQKRNQEELHRQLQKQTEETGKETWDRLGAEADIIKLREQVKDKVLKYEREHHFMGLLLDDIIPLIQQETRREILSHMNYRSVFGGVSGEWALSDKEYQALKSGDGS